MIPNKFNIGLFKSGVSIINGTHWLDNSICHEVICKNGTTKLRVIKFKNFGIDLVIKIK